MTPFGRAVIGALMGAVVTLCIHPVSRPYMLGLGMRESPEALSLCVDSNSKRLPAPKTLDEASLWMQLAASRIRNLERLTPKERTTLLAIADVASKQDLPNAFWHQMKSMVYDEGGDHRSAIRCWLDASKCIQWNDYQTRRLAKARESLVDLTGE